jgi:type I restriction enzyme S subunit
MEVKKVYKQTEGGVIPSDWEVRQLGDIGECLIGLTYKPTDVKKSGTLVLRSSNIQNNHLAFEDNVYVEADIPERIKLKNNDILICVRNGSRELIGKCALLDSRVTGETFGAFMCVFRTAYPHYVFQQFMSNNIQAQIHRHLGATINQITNKSLNSFTIPFPSSPEERSNIAVVLFDAEALVDSLEKLIAKKKAIKQGTMQLLLTGKKRLPGFGGEWEMKELREIVDFSNGKAHENFISDDGDYIVVNSKFISSEGQVVKYSKKCFCPATANSILMVMSDVPNGRAISKCFLVDKDNRYTVNQRICVLKSKIDPLFSFYKIDRNPFYLSFDDGVKQTNLRKTDVLDCKLNMPKDKEEQVAIAQVICNMGAEIEDLEQKLAKYNNIKQGMMQVLLTGKIRLLSR